MSCVLCLAQDESYRLIHKNEHVFITMNLEPLREAHVMVLPIRHARQVSDLDGEEAVAFLRAIDQCMEIAARISPDPSICTINGWTHRSQDHLHAHILPSKGGLRGMMVASEGVPHRQQADEPTLIRLANIFRTAFDASL